MAGEQGEPKGEDEGEMTSFNANSQPDLERGPMSELNIQWLARFEEIKMEKHDLFKYKKLNQKDSYNTLQQLGLVDPMEEDPEEVGGALLLVTDMEDFYAERKRPQKTIFLPSTKLVR